MLTDAIRIALGRMGRETIRKAQRNLSSRKSRKVASGRTITSKIDNSGKLSASLKYEQRAGKLTFQMAEYGLYVDEGRKPGKYVPPKVIEEWIKSKPIRLRDLKTGRFMQQTPQAMKSLAFLINRGIHDNGILPTKFFSKPLEQEIKRLDNTMPEALYKDIETSFNRFTDA